MKLSHIMTGGIESVLPQTTLAEAAKKMASQDIGSLPVCTERHTVVGIITDRDITVRAVARGMDPNQTRVEDVMTREVLSCSSDADVEQACARRARERYACFDHFKEDSRRYGYATAFGMSKSCEDEVVAQLVEMRSRAAAATADPDELFYAEQNARLVKNAEEYYRTMFHGRVSSWNLRDQHMAQTLEALALHLAGEVVVWAHNSHVGDARATEMGERGELTLGQLARERYLGNTLPVGMTTYRGSVTAASDWDGPAERKRVRDALPGSHEEELHRVGLPGFFVPAAALDDRRLERAIGVVYLPETERLSHYYHADVSRQFDALLHFGETRALEPLDREPLVETREAPETFPAGV